MLGDFSLHFQLVENESFDKIQTNMFLFHFFPAIQSLDALNDQIIAFVFSPNVEALHLSGGSGRNGDAEDPVKAAINLMRKLLLDAQAKFRKMVEENKALGGRLDTDLAMANQQMALLRAELSDTARRVSQLNSPPSTPSTPSHADEPASNGHGNNRQTLPNGDSLTNDSLPGEKPVEMSGTIDSSAVFHLSTQNFFCL